METEMKWHIENLEDSDSYGIFDEAQNWVASVPNEKNAEQIALLPEMRSALEWLEWRSSDEFSFSCWFCGHLKRYGHAETCTLGNLLKKIRGEA